MIIFNQFVTDTKKDVAFYHGTMGFPVVAAVPAADGGITLLNAGTAYLSLIQSRSVPQDSFPTVLTVPKLEQKLAELAEKGEKEIYPAITLPLCRIAFTQSRTGTKSAWVEYDTEKVTSATAIDNSANAWMNFI